jgi:hypothetical protein
MLDALATAMIAILEKEIIKHEPEIQAFLLEQVTRFSDLLYEYVREKLNPAPTLEELEMTDVKYIEPDENHEQLIYNVSALDVEQGHNST